MTTEELVRHLRTVQTSLHLGYYQDVRAARLLVEMLLRELPGDRLTRTTTPESTERCPVRRGGV